MSFDFKKDPFENFLESLKQAQIKGVPDHNAMALATVNEKNEPSVRIVFYKGLIRRGFSFYTNYLGHKGKDLEQNKNVSVNFFWSHLDQQIRVDGVVEKLTNDESDAYFASRARLSQIGAWASNQSEKIESFAAFEEKIVAIEKKYAGQTVPRPPHWGGYIIVPREIEFWFGRSGRLHERYVYEKNNQDWNRFLRSP
ncbi:MAG: pyridoxamine 5'-phosphate oxidase [Bdellovibrio sp.]|nr:pyridoxamine 5'-phosphate oxidase [Bdellovibrio sp.]